MKPAPFELSPDAEPVGSGNLLTLLPLIIWERKAWIIVCTILGMAGGVVASILIPPVYRSEATLLVESAQLPEELINLDTDDLIERRVASILQQVTARPDLVELIERHGLYSEQRRSGSLSEVIDEMRSSISLNPTQSSLSNARNRELTAIAFTLFFEYSEPVAAQAVAQDLMDNILQLEARGNAEQAENTEQFLRDEARGLEAQIGGIQTQMAEINARSGGILEGNVGYISDNSVSYDIQIASLRRDNQSLLQQRALALGSAERDPIVLAAEQRLAGAKAMYADTHPDVVFARQALEEARELAAANVGRIPVETIDQQIEFNNSQIASMQAAKAQEAAQGASQRSAQSRAPLIRQQLEELRERLNAVNTQYDRVQNQLAAAQAGVRAEDERMAERLSVVEPPIIPDEPTWPNRLLLLAIGFGGGLGLGFVLAFAVELLLRPIRDPSQLTKITGVAPMGLIPIIESKSKQPRWWQPFKKSHGTA